MSRSGYSEECDGWALIRWRGAVKSAIRGKRGQAFLKELLAALDAMPVKELVYGDLVTPQGEVCAIGCVMVARGFDASQVDKDCPEQIGEMMGIPRALVAEIEYINDEMTHNPWVSDPAARAEMQKRANEKRFHLVRTWVSEQIIAEAS